MLFIEAALVRRVELAHAWRNINYARAQEGRHPELPVRMQAIGDGYAIYAGPNAPVNRAIALGTTGAVARADVDRVVEFYQARSAPARVDVVPAADRSLLQVSREAGFQLERFLNLWVAPLASLGSGSEAEGVAVTRARPEEADLWIKTVAEGFEGKEPASPEALDIIAANFYAPGAVCFFARIGGEPAGGGGMYVHEGVAEFGSASTRAKFRRRGVQTALLRARLRAAQERGCEFAIVLTGTGSDSQRNVQRAGFQLAYTRATLIREV